MITDKLYEAAFRYRQSRLWKKIWDNQLFAVELDNGEKGYVSVMGRTGSYLGLTVYIGDDGFQGFREIAALDPMSFKSHFEQQEAFLCQDGLNMSLENKDMLSEEELSDVRKYAKGHGVRFAGKNSFPQFLKHERNKLPWKIKSEEDQDLLAQALNAAADISELIENGSGSEDILPEITLNSGEMPLLTLSDGKYVLSGMTPLPEQKEKIYPAPTAMNEITLRKVRNLKKKGTLECDVVLYPEPVQEDYESTPFFPHMLIAVDSKTGFSIPPTAVEDYMTAPEKMMNHFLDRLLEYEFGPSGFFVRDDRTYAFLSGLAEKLGIKVTVRQDLSALENFEYDLLVQIENDTGDNPEQMYALISGILQMDDKDLDAVPEELRIQFRQMINEGQLPEEMATALKNKLNL